MEQSHSNELRRIWRVMTDATIWIILGVGYVLTWLLIPWVLLRRSVDPSASVAWIMSIIFMPYLGALLCAVFGSIRWEAHRNRKQRATAEINRQIPDWADEHLASEESLGEWQSLGRLAAQLTESRLTDGNDVDLLTDTNQTLELMEEAIRNARQWVHVGFYIWRHDATGTRMRDLLIDKARQGVQVRFLYDGIGSILLPRRFLKPMTDAGVQVAPFTPGPRLWNLLSLNMRNHRKIVLADGRVGFTGGMNIGDEYLRPTRKFGELRDMQVRVRGPAVLQLQEVFARDWHYATGEALTGEEYYPNPDDPGRVPAQVIADGPDDDVDAIYSLLVAALGQSRKRVTLTTPYFVPPEGVIVALETAARRGVRVRLMISDRGNEFFIREAGRSYYEPLMRAGVEIYEYERGLLHAKSITVDGCWLFVGTPNWDFRSLFLNFEIGLIFFDGKLAEEVEQEFEHDLQYARRIDLAQWRQRSKLTILGERFWYLFAPTL